jgi:hypothetical protein
MVTTIIMLILFAFLTVWVGGIFYALRKGINEIIEAFSSFDEKLTELVENTKK